MGYQVIRTAIQVVGCNNVFASLNNVLQSVCDGCGSRCYGKSGYTTLKGSNTVFENSLGRIGQSTIDITGIAQPKTVGSVL
jgi:hypothetical protein